MANVTVSWTMSEGDRERLVKMLCGEAGEPAAAATAHRIQLEEWRARVVAFEQRQAPIVPPTIT